jgi:hypothetical protein
MTRRIETGKAILPQTSNVGQRFSLSNLLAKLFLRDDLMKRKTILTFWKGLGCHLRVWTGICGNFLQTCNIWEQASSSIAYRVVSTPSKKAKRKFCAYHDSKSSTFIWTLLETLAWYLSPWYYNYMNPKYKTIEPTCHNLPPISEL